MWEKDRTSSKQMNFQEKAALMFVFIMLMPNILLACTEDYSAAAIAASLLLPGACYLLWSMILRRPGAMILWALPMMILGAFQIVLIYLFGGSIIAVDMFTNLFTTNASEAGELLGSLWPSILFVCLLYIPLIAVGFFMYMSTTTMGMMYPFSSGLLIGFPAYPNMMGAAEQINFSSTGTFGAIMIVTMRSVALSIVRVAIMAGTLQPKPTMSGTKALPGRPMARMMRSITKAARAI